MREEMEVDPQGRTVRAKLCATIADMDENGKKVQKTLWFGRDAEPNLMRLALQQRRQSILGDCRQLKTDMDSYNDNNQWGALIQLTFDFEKDLDDLSHDTEYNPQPPSGED